MTGSDYGAVFISCGNCGKKAELDRWINTVTGPMPEGEFQCPNCNHAFKRQVKANRKPWDKFVVIVPTQPRL